MKKKRGKSVGGRRGGRQNKKKKVSETLMKNEVQRQRIQEKLTRKVNPLRNEQRDEANGREISDSSSSSSASELENGAYDNLVELLGAREVVESAENDGKGQEEEVEPPDNDSGIESDGDGDEFVEEDEEVEFSTDGAETVGTNEALRILQIEHELLEYDMNAEIERKISNSPLKWSETNQLSKWLRYQVCRSKNKIREPFTMAVHF